VTAEVVQISSGSGPAEVREFVARLARRLVRLCEERGLHVREVAHDGPDAAPLSVELRVAGGAAAALAGEVGVHQLVARSPRRGRSSRKRWFADVSIRPENGGAAAGAPLILERDLVVTASRSGGRGGQHVNKVSTAVRVHHVPSGITVRVASERSQRQNLRIAIERIAEIDQRRREDARQRRSTERHRSRRDVTRGNAVRTYRLTPAGDLDVVTPILEGRP
jgi:peptide chain release factor 2/peptide chain release factor